MTSKTYPFDPAKAEAACAELKEKTGVVIDPQATSGETEIHHVHLSWNIVPSDAVTGSNNIVVTIVSKPFYIPESAIFGPLDAAFAVSPIVV